MHASLRAASHACACTYRSESATRLAGVKKPWLPFGVRTYRSCCMMLCGATPHLHCGYGHRQGEGQGSCDRVGRLNGRVEAERRAQTFDTTAMTTRTATGRTSMTSALDAAYVITGDTQSS